MSEIKLLARTAITPICWGTTYITATHLVAPGHPMVTALIRALPAGVVLLVWNRTLPKGDWWWKSFVLGALNIGCFFALLFISADLLPGGAAAVITNTGPLVVMAASPFLLGRRIRAAEVIAGMVAVAGVACLALSPGAVLSAAGVISAACSSLSMGLGMVLAKKWGAPPGVNQLTVTGWQLTFGGIILVPVALLVDDLPQQITPVNVVGYLWLILAGTVIAYGLWFSGLARLDAVSVSLLSVLSPVTATVLGVTLAGERFTALQAAGAVMVVGGVVAAQTVGARNRQKNIPPARETDHSGR